MVPKTLTLENFLSYREQQTLELSELELACLAGDNGNGKSALLDAITWALWGRARQESGSGKPDADLLNRQAIRSEGATEMEVTLQFETGGEPYEVVRNYRESATGKTTRGNVSFFSLGGSRTDLTAGTMRETQSLIDEAVGTKYNTFINTAFVIQGQSDQFTQKTPSKRKDVLANVLRLGRFDELADQTRRERKQLHKSQTSAEGRIRSLKKDLDGAEKRKRELQAKRQKTADVKNQLEKTQDKLEEARNEMEKSRGAKEELDRLENKARELSKEIKELSDEYRGLEKDLESYEELLEQEDRIRGEWEAYKEAQKKRNGMEDLLSETRACEKQIQKLQAKIDKADEALRRETNEARRRRDDAWDALVDLHGETPESPSEVPEAIENRIEELEEKKPELEKLESEIEALENAAERARELREEVRRRIAIKRSRIEDEQSFLDDLEELEGGECPRCGQSLNEEHVDDQFAQSKAKIRALEKDVQDLEEREEALTSKAEEVYSEKTSKEKQAENLQEEINQIPQLAGDLTSARAKKEAYLAADNRVFDLQSKDDPYQMIGFGAYQDWVDEIEKHQSRIDEIGYDPKKMAKAKATIKDLEGIGEQMQKLERALDRKSIIEGKKKSIAEEGEELEEEREETRSKIEEVKEEARKLPQREQRFQKLQTQLSAEEEKQENLTSEIGRLEGLVSADEEKQSELEEAEEHLSSLKEKMDRLSHLRDAFGKHGIPSLIIEDAIPQLEARANELLDRITEGMSVRLETTREKQSGGTSDTLDVIIESASGAARPYETYSGGESFRVDFALRVALSQLLARRSGAPLKTLVIDEGFGTQDPEGLEAMKQAIAEIAEDFELVLVITHLDELKNAFPQRIQVQKTPGRGSTFTVHK
jgi:exonuclease SbcC